MKSLSFHILDGDAENRFYRGPKIAAHAIATPGRFLVAFPAGDMGAAFWLTEPAALTMGADLTPIERPAGMRGVEALVHAPASTLVVKAALVASVRELRNEELHKPVAPEVQARFAARGAGVVLARATLDGGHHVEMTIEPLEGGSVRIDDHGAVVIAGAPGAAKTSVRVQVLADDTPLTPVPLDDLLLPSAAAEPRARDVLAFLSYEEKLLAGSWHYLTYFGRDTLLTVRLLMPALRPRVIEAAIGSVIDRLGPDGEVAHEEEIGEFAAERNADRSQTPRFDYKMVDDDFLLPAVLGDYAAPPEFFARRTPRGRPYTEALHASFERVLRLAGPFAAKQEPTALVALHPGERAGNWRDSQTGLGEGRFPYDVNAALVPAALDAIAKYTATGAALADAGLHGRALALRAAWTNVERFFVVNVPADEARARVKATCEALGLDPREALAAIHGPVVLRGVSLDAEGKPVPVMNTDDGFLMLFGKPDAALLEEMAARIEQPFPVGLRTPVGVVVSNATFSPDEKVRAVFTTRDYHGTVVWSWQQALLAVGLRRQIERADLPPKTKQVLLGAEKSLWAVIEATAEASTAELWSFRVDSGRFVRVPFGQEAGHKEESNAAQLWSTVYLAVKRPVL